MTRNSYRERPDVEERFIRRELAERDLDLLRRGVMLALTVAVVVVAIICVLRGAWPLGAAASTCIAAAVRSGARH
jgi:hypothetical protein